MIALRKSHARIIISCLLIFVMENVSYFVVGTYYGQLWGLDKTSNLMLGIDAFIPWFTPFYLYYFIWPLAFFIIIPFVLWKAVGRRGIALYVVVSIGMYLVGTYLYQVFPTTYTPMDFIDGTFGTLSQADPFYDFAKMLASNVSNVWGAFPSYHNFWGALLVLLPLVSRVNPSEKSIVWVWISIVIGLLISLATLLLHQHAILDVVLTYVLTFILYWIGSKTKLYDRAQRWLFSQAS